MSDIEASWEKKYNLLLLKMAQDKQDSDLYFKMLNEALEENKQLQGIIERNYHLSGFNDTGMDGCDVTWITGLKKLEAIKTRIELETRKGTTNADYGETLDDIYHKIIGGS